MSASKGPTTVDHGQDNKRRHRNQFEGNYFDCAKKDRRTGEYRSARKKFEKSGDDTVDKKGGRRRESYVCTSEENMYTSTVACASVLSIGLASMMSDE